MSSAIGPYSFRRMSRPPQAVESSLTIVAHAGVDAHQLWDDGERGAPFQVQTEAVLANVLQGIDLIKEYKSLISSDPVAVEWAGVSLPEHLYQVLKVDDLDGGLRPILLGLGPLGSTHFGVLICTWTLLPLKQ